MAKKTEQNTKEEVIKAEDAQSKIRIKIKAYDHKVIDDSTKKIVETAQRTGATVVGPVPIPTEVRKMTVNRSTFKHKSARDQYEIRIHKRLVDILSPSNATIESLTNMDLPAGVGIEIKM